MSEEPENKNQTKLTDKQKAMIFVAIFLVVSFTYHHLSGNAKMFNDLEAGLCGIEDDVIRAVKNHAAREEGTLPTKIEIDDIDEDCPKYAVQGRINNGSEKEFTVTVDFNGKYWIKNYKSK